MGQWSAALFCPGENGTGHLFNRAGRRFKSACHALPGGIRCQAGPITSTSAVSTPDSPIFGGVLVMLPNLKRLQVSSSQAATSIPAPHVYGFAYVSQILYTAKMADPDAGPDRYSPVVPRREMCLHDWFCRPLARRGNCRKSQGEKRAIAACLYAWFPGAGAVQAIAINGK